MWSARATLLVCVALPFLGCSSDTSGRAAQPSTLHALFSGADSTNATTSNLDLTFRAGGPNGTVMLAAAYAVAGGEMTIVWSDGGAPERRITVQTPGMPAAGQAHDASATLGSNAGARFTYGEGAALWDGTGTIVIDSVDPLSLVRFTADMAMQPDAASPAGAQGSFTIDVSSASAVLGL